MSEPFEFGVQDDGSFVMPTEKVAELLRRSAILIKRASKCGVSPLSVVVTGTGKTARKENPNQAYPVLL